MNWNSDDMNLFWLPRGDSDPVWIKCAQDLSVQFLEDPRKGRCPAQVYVTVNMPSQLIGFHNEDGLAVTNDYCGRRDELRREAVAMQMSNCQIRNRWIATKFTLGGEIAQFHLELDCKLEMTP